MMKRSEIGIRRLTDQDLEPVRRLAERDSADVPSGRLLGATVDGHLVAARSLTTGEAIADPFVPTEEILVLLASRAEQIRGGRSPGIASRLRRRSRYSSSSSRVAT